ncbi:hypothetical protein BC833DRAFT_583018 [Globomyces pollinis-pini]|nr:hypothetical protein BC833DRAFT_583018 [Globomyces pollinis-pini]
MAKTLTIVDIIGFLPPKYDGKSSAYVFVEAFKHVVQAESLKFDWNDRKRAEIFQMWTVNEAAHWVIRMRTSGDSKTWDFDTWCTNLIIEFPPKREVTYNLAGLRSIRVKLGDFEEFNHEFLRYSKRLKRKNIEGVILNYYWQCLKDSDSKLFEELMYHVFTIQPDATKLKLETVIDTCNKWVTFKAEVIGDTVVQPSISGASKEPVDSSIDAVIKRLDLLTEAVCQMGNQMNNSSNVLCVKCGGSEQSPTRRPLLLNSKQNTRLNNSHIPSKSNN